jgi:hypothetical protein
MTILNELIGVSHACRGAVAEGLRMTDHFEDVP